MGVAAVILDLDGVLVDSEGAWAAVRKEIALQHGGRWPAGSERAMMGMSSTEWSTYMRDELGVAMEPQEMMKLWLAPGVEGFGTLYETFMRMAGAKRE